MIDNKTLSDRLFSAVNGELGWNGSADPEGDIRFDSEMGFTVWMPLDIRDPEYVHMFTGFSIARFSQQVGASLETSRPDVQRRLLECAIRITHKLKGAKVVAIPGEDTVLFSVEMIAAGKNRMPTTELLASILPRMRTMLLAAVADFREEVILLGHSTAELADLSPWEE